MQIKPGKKGVILYIVLSSLILVVILAGIVINLMLSQGFFTKHQTNRIQAFYAAKAGMNYAYEKLMFNVDPNWPNTGEYTRKICRSGCTPPDVNEPDLPNSIQEVSIHVFPPGSGVNNTRRIRITSTFSL